MSAIEIPVKGKSEGNMSAVVADKEQVESLQQSASLQAKGSFRKFFLMKYTFGY